MSTLEVIKAAIEQHRAAHVARVLESYRARVAAAYAEFADVDWDLDRLAPYPKSGIGKAAYKAELARRNWLEGITNYTKASRMPSEPNTRAPLTAEQVAAGEARIEKMASADFDAYAAKLAAKIGDGVSAATVCGSALWYGSTLTVTKADGSVERWHTQTIINCSVHGKLFNQFPTRKLK